MKTVALLFGGKSQEHFISCISAKSIYEHANKENYQIDLIGITKENKWYFYQDELSYLEDGTWENHNIKPILNVLETLKQYDVIFPITHGAYGEDGKLQGLLEFTNVPYVGGKTLSSAINMDKGINKKLLSFYGIPQVPFVTLKKETPLETVTSTLTFPVIIKPCNGGSSIGIKKANTYQELKKAITYAFQYDDEILVEKFLKVRELECGILKTDTILISDIGEILPANDYYDYESKYEKKESIIKIPAQIPVRIKKEIQDLANKLFEITKCDSFARIDFFYEEKSGKLYYNEINTLPGFTSISMYPKLMEQKGITYSDLISSLIENAS